MHTFIAKGHANDDEVGYLLARNVICTYTEYMTARLQHAELQPLGWTPAFSVQGNGSILQRRYTRGAPSDKKDGDSK